jgi:hypothetical protein
VDSYGDWLSGVVISLQIRIKFRACEEPILGTALHPVAVRSCSFHPCECVISVFFWKPRDLCSPVLGLFTSGLGALGQRIREVTSRFLLVS